MYGLIMVLMHLHGVMYQFLSSSTSRLLAHVLGILSINNCWLRVVATALGGLVAILGWGWLKSNQFGGGRILVSSEHWWQCYLHVLKSICAKKDGSCR